MDARHPGANHDAFVWDQSAANHFYKNNYENGKRNTWILGKVMDFILFIKKEYLSSTFILIC